MAFTISNVFDQVPGATRLVVRDFTFDSSYPTGGEPITAADFGSNRIFAILAAFEANGVAAKRVVFNAANSKLQVFVEDAGGVEAEAANGSDQSGVKARVVALVQ